MPREQAARKGLGQTFLREVRYVLRHKRSATFAAEPWLDGSTSGCFLWPGGSIWRCFFCQHVPSPRPVHPTRRISQKKVYFRGRLPFKRPISSHPTHLREAVHGALVSLGVHALHLRLNHVKRVVAQGAEASRGHAPKEVFQVGQRPGSVVAQDRLVLVEPHES